VITGLICGNDAKCILEEDQMFNRVLFSVALLLTGFCLVQSVQAQTLNGLLTGRISDYSGATVPGAQITAVNQATGETRTANSNEQGIWLIPQMSPGTYKVAVAKQGFATVAQDNVKLDVNGSITLNFQLKVGVVNETIQVTTAPPLLNTTSATLSTVVGHQEVVDLPLNGREFTQLALLSPGAAPVGGYQQGSFTISEGGGGISPSVNGQRGQSNNFTIDGIENNQLFDNAWAISPPPDAIQEFNVQAHMTDAQFGVSSGANINVQTRPGTNSFHGAAWEFVRNNAFDANTYPNATRPFYHQNQYGFFVGGPIFKNHTFFSGYWEGYRFGRASTQFGSTLTSDEIAGDFSQFVGKTVIGTDHLGRPEYAHELYDATTSRPDPVTPSLTIRDPFPAAPGGSPGSMIPSNYISPQALIFIKKYYPAPNMNVAPGVFPNFEYFGKSVKNGDQFGARFDQQLKNNDSVFVRLARNNIHSIGPAAFNTLPGGIVLNFANEIELGYTHIFDLKTILNIRAAFVFENLASNSGETYDPTLTAAMGTQLVSVPRLGADVPLGSVLGNGVTAISNVFNPLGPSSFYEYNIDASRTMGNHTISGGGMFLPIRQVTDDIVARVTSTEAGTSLNGNASGATGLGPASYLEGIVDQYYTYNLLKNLDLTVPWWAFYGQDQWKVTQKLVLTFGTRWDYIAASNYHRSALVFDPITGKMWGVGSIPTSPALTALLPVGNPTLYQAGQGYFATNKNGWEPRFGATYQFLTNTVGHLAFALMDQHDNQLIQGNQNLALNWPNGSNQTLSNLDTGVPKMYLNTLPTQASLLDKGNPAVGTTARQNTPISYVEEYNVGIQQQLPDNLVLNVDYVGSVGRHQWANTQANTAMYPGPGSIQSRAQYPQYGILGTIGAMDPTSYNGLQAKLVRPFASGATFTASYTWSKSLDVQSDPYGPAPKPNWYNPLALWGRSLFDIPQLFVFSGVYQLPFGNGRQFMHTPNQFIQVALGGWQAAGILSLHSGTPLFVGSGADFANTGWGFEPAVRGLLSPYTKAKGGASGLKQWLTPPTPYTGTALPDPSTFAFAVPLPYTVGNEKRNDLSNPGYKNVDFNVQKNFPLWESAEFQFRTEFFNLFNHTNYAGTSGNANTPSGFGLITTVNGNARIIQFSGKINF
jgi:hypothetical protein